MAQGRWSASTNTLGVPRGRLTPTLGHKQMHLLDYRIPPQLTWTLFCLTCLVFGTASYLAGVHAKPIYCLTLLVFIIGGPSYLALMLLDLYYRRIVTYHDILLGIFVFQWVILWIVGYIALMNCTKAPCIKLSVGLCSICAAAVIVTNRYVN